MIFFLLLIGVLRRDRLSIMLVMIVSFLYGGMIWGVLPQKPEISFEYHLAGALAGLVAAAWLRNRDPIVGRRLYAREPESAAVEEEEDPVIGDLWRPPAERDAPPRDER